jgi:hypothetical protein
MAATVTATELATINYAEMTAVELRKLAAQAGVPGARKGRKDDLIAALDRILADHAAAAQAEEQELADELAAERAEAEYRATDMTEVERHKAQVLAEATTITDADIARMVEESTEITEAAPAAPAEAEGGDSEEGGSWFAELRDNLAQELRAAEAPAAPARSTAPNGQRVVTPAGAANAKAEATLAAAQAGEFDADPIIDGVALSTMKFDAVMALAKKYQVPGRGFARIAALRAGVALAISQEVGRAVAATQEG